MDSEFEYIMALANEGKYAEARKAVEALDVSATHKATLNMQICRRPRYHAIWKYSYNGTVYIHKDMASYKSPYYGERSTLLIDPRDPHNTYRKKAPITSIFYIASGLFIVLYALEPLIDKLPH
ncbi:hypothetical protein [Ruminococcus flavefaciens]|uniref:hypothetical protein n=1 Tax=Ruminococcus flavefaciens TaxID=1265 RepID=UPI0013DBC066|nr:hypothetical protein [Ruminococcus flavefaciens]